MRDGFVRVASVTTTVQVGNCVFNADQIIGWLQEAEKQECDLVVFPELCVTGYTCGDLFYHSLLLESAKTELLRIAEATKNYRCIAIVGLPLIHHTKLYNCAAVLHQGHILGVVPKRNIPNYTEFYEARYFTPYREAGYEMLPFGETAPVPFGTILFDCSQAVEEFVFGVEICEDLWVPDSPSADLARMGAMVLCNLSASNETVGKAEYRRMLVQTQSGKLVCAYVFSDAGEGESTTDLVFSGHKLIAENGRIAAETQPFGAPFVMADVDVRMLCQERRRINTFSAKKQDDAAVVTVPLVSLPHPDLRKTYSAYPFVPADPALRECRCQEILNMQVAGLRKRLVHTGIACSVIGISGGLDSTLALLVTVRAYDQMERSRSEIVAVTMPCFGTTDRTYQNAVSLCRELGVTLREISIREAVSQHFRDIGHDASVHNVTYENAQARERTQVLMDIANQVGGMVIGTGDLSELALGWATYNGDHMSMYGVNGSVPKTLVRYLVDYVASLEGPDMAAILRDILDTPVSPELLPPEEGVISQKTEDLVGPYELHDFFLYYFMRFAFSPSKIYRLARLAFAGRYEDAVIRKWLRVFVKRFFTQQYKRSCMPDGPKVGSVSLSPRGDLRLPSDAQAALWIREADRLCE